jgi:hydroxymethylpyrimidine/phosphomethylpyrimidine kinase
MVEAVAFAAAGFQFPLIVDPVMISKHGAPLMAEDARSKLIQLLMPAAALLTPNLHEAEAITGRKVENLQAMREAAAAILDLGAGAVLLKGGHLEGAAMDFLLWHGGEIELPGERIQTQHTHGTGCSYSAAITALIASGVGLESSVRQAKAWIQNAIATNPGLGRGNGPVNHFAKPGPLNNGN